MIHRKALERWEKRVGKCEVTSQVLRLIAKSFMKMDGPKAPTDVHGALGLTYYPNEKAKATADYLENQFTSHDLCDKNYEYERSVKTRVQALLTFCI
jgi:hypothetical protein